MKKSPSVCNPNCKPKLSIGRFASLRRGSAIAFFAAMAALLVPVVPLKAGPFPAAVDLWRLGAGDRLVINRGGPVHDAGDVNGDGLVDVIVGSGIGTVRVVFGPTNGADGRLDTSIQRGIGGFGINGDAYRVGAGGDFNGDGLGDMVVGSTQATHVVFGRRSGFPSTVDVNELDGSDGFTVRSAGDSVAIVADVNGDGLDELLLGSRQIDAPGSRDSGRALLVFGRRAAMPASLSPYNLNRTMGMLIHGEQGQDLLGWSVESAGDINADGLGDLVIGATGSDVNGQDEAGRVYVIYGSPDLPTVFQLADIDRTSGLVFVGRDAEDVAGYSARTAGDLNADGIDDLAIGAPGKGPFGSPNEHPGEAYVIFGSSELPAQLAVDELNGNNGFMLRGIRRGTVPEQSGRVAWGDQAGASVSAAGDINSDGIDDLIVGAPYTILSETRRGNGQVYVIYGRRSGFPDRLFLADLNGENGFRWNGTGTTDYTGFSVSRAGDFNNDGIDDVIVGASGQGETFLLYGKPGQVFP